MEKGGSKIRSDRKSKNNITEVCRVPSLYLFSEVLTLPVILFFDFVSDLIFSNDDDDDIIRSTTYYNNSGVIFNNNNKLIRSASGSPSPRRCGCEP